MIEVDGVARQSNNKFLIIQWHETHVKGSSHFGDDHKPLHI